MISIFQGQSPQNKAEFPIKTAGSVGYAFLFIFWLLGKLFNSDQIAEVTPKRSSLVRECPQKAQKISLRRKQIAQM